MRVSELLAVGGHLGRSDERLHVPLVAVAGEAQPPTPRRFGARLCPGAGRHQVHAVDGEVEIESVDRVVGREGRRATLRFAFAQGKPVLLNLVLHRGPPIGAGTGRSGRCRGICRPSGHRRRRGSTK
ncbi:MAG: hypothetical protein EHM56_14215 [Chloroflexi bacterium]|nr:MAG: hypothetical protein EHM56_14215 [Chloroflexota bacterium]